MVRADDTVDLDEGGGAGTSFYAFDAPKAGKLLVNQCFCVWEAEATGTQTATQGVISIEVGGTEVALLTANQGASVDDSQIFAADGTNNTAANAEYPIASGDSVDVKIKTIAVGGTLIGEGRVHLAFQLAD